jgi:iron complex transport system ATP-binding protein
MSLCIEGLAFGYGRRSLFSGLAAPDLARGRLAALVGPNGAGKSTLFRLVAGLATPAAGRISLDGTDLSALPSRRRAERVFLLGQQVAMRAALAVFDVVLLARRAGRGSSDEDLAAVEATLGELGIEDLADRPVAELSGGQQQLVALAQGLVRDPDVLLSCTWCAGSHASATRLRSRRCTTSASPAASPTASCFCMRAASPPMAMP